jgi:UDP-N-acetyl-D-glucosamine/UDP-N-acetyl-D-galactosamine dehydrogenase
MPPAPPLAASDRIAVIGLGYVGLPLAVALARAGAGEVTGFDIDPARLAELAAGRDRTGEVEPADLHQPGRLALTGDPERLRDQGVYIVTVPTPVDSANKPDLGPLVSACATVGQALAGRAGELGAPIVVFESTVYPGVTEDICGPAIARASGLQPGEGFHLGYSPERINPGDRQHGLGAIVKVVAGATPEVAQRLAALYGRVSAAGIHLAPNIRTAEAAKAIENAQRDINIAFVNEVAMICGDLGLSVYDVLDAARTKWNFIDFRPGLVGGHCIGVDPFYLAHCARALGHEAEVILAGRRINDAMGGHFAERIDAAAKAAGIGAPAPGPAPRSLVLGLTFKENLPDLRNSKVVDLIRGLQERGHRVSVHDPRADPAEAKAVYGLDLLPGLDSDSTGPGYDCVIAAVAHEQYRRLDDADLARLARPAGLIADIKGIWRGRTLPAGRHRWQL